MADDDDDLNDFKLPPHSNEDADAQLDAKALKLVEEYVASLRRSQNENTIRQGVRETIVKLGIHSLAFQHELNAAKMMDKADRTSYMASRRRMGRILSDKVETLFGPEQEVLKKRKARKAEQKAKADAAAAKGKADSIEKGDTNPRSDPNRGGAKPRTGRKTAAPASAADRAETTAERTQRLAEAAQASAGAEPGAMATPPGIDAEQAEGEAVLDGALAGIKARAEAEGAPLSQSAQAAAVRDKLGLK